jgi:hypothetical protein
MIADRRVITALERWSRHLHTLAGIDLAPDWPPESAVRPARSGPGGPGGEVTLWRSLAAGACGVAESLRRAGVDLAAAGPLWVSSDWAAIEVWTEAELCGLHGLWRAGRIADGIEPKSGGALRERLTRAVHWHLEHTQPDNATNRPWAVHVFLLDGSDEARLYGETLVHNAQAQGNEDPASRWILADAARELNLSLRADGEATHW